ncbi:MAG: 4,5:9,10-diseco-3-hydroxy-5,9,17-trioxoandrosta-1(10),2-diene-4-oate hydrolase [Bacteroidetes bacterium ADurb.Bin408]|nr:MAG: 4,5:9,10-diseco-3-hydroxy-5,9,17-trioxoandrosta-1(10),2-diene-4-oate hydrolase [Bacteroidetes bacterium ADurb.Bin408]
MYYKFNSKRVHYTVAGKGPCIVLLHGFTEDASIWDNYTNTLKENFTVLTPDLPGHGLSETWETPHTMEKQAELLKNLLDNLNIKTIVLIGHSMGGYVALAFAEAYPQYLKGLCLFHSSALADSPETLAVRDKTISIVRQNKFSFLSQFIPDLFAQANRLLYEKEIQSLVAKAADMKPEGVINAIEGMKIRPDRCHVLKSLQIPILFIAGKQDNRVPVEKLLAQMVLPTHTEALVLGNVGHMGYIEAADEILITFNNFINKIYSK